MLNKELLESQLAELPLYVYEFIDPAEPMPPPAEFLARRRTFPAGTWGSVFKNPPGDFAGRLLEEAGAKGLRTALMRCAFLPALRFLGMKKTALFRTVLLLVCFFSSSHSP